MRRIPIDSVDELRKRLSTQRVFVDTRLGKVLVQSHFISSHQLEEALLRQKRDPGRHLGQVLIDMGWLTQEQVTLAMATKLGIPYIGIKDLDIAPAVLARLPADLALKYNVLPLDADDGKIVVAMENPLNQQILDALRFNTRAQIEAVMASPQDLALQLSRHYSKEDESRALLEMQTEIRGGSESVSQAAARRGAEDETQRKPIVRLLNSVLLYGITHGASDINVRPQKDRVTVYYRIDGRLHLVRTFDRSLHAPLVSRIKILGQMDIAEHRLPQDGHARVHRAGKAVDLRISVLPTLHGESVVLRLLDKEIGLKPLEDIGFGPTELETIKRILLRPHGLFFVTGPTGAGKSTTLYALLNEIKKRAPHILTVEDPIEYDMEGVEQVQVVHERGCTFASLLRQFLRHDPDVIMVGEVRDEETARIANMAALTGHLVLSTLHTNDAVSSIARLLDMGVESYLLSSTLLGVLAQRLVRLNCSKCLRPDPGDPFLRRTFNVRPQEKFYKGVGCAACNRSGYSGRTMVSELLTVTPEISQMINERASMRLITDKALQQGMVRLIDNALLLARLGKTSLEEVFSIKYDI